MGNDEAQQDDIELIECIDEFLAGVAANDTCPEMREAQQTVAAVTGGLVQCIQDEAGNPHIAVICCEHGPSEMNGFLVAYYETQLVE